MTINKITVVIALIVIVIAAPIGVWVIVRKQTKIPGIPPPQSSKMIRYLPLGDSYTIGQNVAETDRWPNQLAAQYQPGGKHLEILANPAKTGYTTQDLIDHELPLAKKLKPSFVTILIGVNDQVQGVNTRSFERNLRYIVADLQKEMAQPQNILLITIPDYSKTPSGANFGSPPVIVTEIEEFNQIIIRVATDAKLPVADIYAISQNVNSDSSLVSSDGLHPSAKQYKTWTDIIIKTLTSANIPL